MQEQSQKKKLLALEKINISVKLYSELKKYFIIKKNNKKNFVKLNEYDAVFTKFNYFIDKDFLGKTPNLKYIISNVTGLDQIDTYLTKKKNIKIFSLKNQTNFLNKISSTAEFTFALIFSLIRKIPQAHNSVLNKKSERYLFIGNNLKNKTIGIIGLGRNGKLIYKYAKSFGMKIIFVDKHFVGNFNGRVSLNKLLKDSDIISINVDLNKTTRNLINFKNLQSVKRNCIIINTSRSEVVNQKAILKVIKSKKLGGYASDFLEQKNSKYTTDSKKLINLAKKVDNLIFTPHIGGATKESLFKTEEFVFKKLISYEKKTIYKR